MRALKAAPLLLAALLLAAGCGDRSVATPSACLQGPGAYLKALEAAPAEVKLAGEVPIGDCLVANQSGGELATVGTAMVTAATELNGRALADPGGAASVQLGYLVGAAQHSAENTEGIHAELIRRLAVAARYTREGPLPPAFLHAYRRGYDAGFGAG
ncbi:MAG TPA: hypothetical protein VG518_09550 [Solirubrobacterales bacterium]|nr:hypothetical protein [Solirubrobacterales bacterium]